MFLSRASSASKKDQRLGRSLAFPNAPALALYCAVKKDAVVAVACNEGSKAYFIKSFSELGVDMLAIGEMGR